MHSLVLGIFLFLVSTKILADDTALARLFVEKGITGTLVLTSLKTGKRFIHDDARARRRFTVASTFKIPNTLIALQEKAIAGKDGILKWDGHIHPDFPDWDRDQTLESAFKISCVWCYQELARRVGRDRYRRYLKSMRYGEWREPFETTTFWLDGSLRISALEQVEFLMNVYRRRFRFFSPATYDTLRDIMVVEQTPAYTIRAKTGWARQADPPIGWYVGYV